MRNLVSIMSATPEYGIGVAKNRFALVDIEDEDPLELLKRKEQEKEERKKAKLAEKENKSTKPVTSTIKPKAQKVLKEAPKKGLNEILKQKDDRKIKREFDNSGRSFNNSNEFREHGKEKWGDDDNLEGNDRNERSGYSADGFQRGRGSGRRFQRGMFVRGGGRGGPRGGFQRTSFDNRGKREYDRQSGSDKTGVKPVDKRDGSGAHNWGNPQDDWNNQEDEWQQQQNDEWNNQEDWDSAGAPLNGEKPTNEESTVDPPNEQLTINPDVNETVQAVEPSETLTVNEDADKKEMTLDEWKALKTPREQPKYNIRKPGEGEDLTQWKNMYALEKKKEGGEDSDDEYEYDFELYPQRVGRQRRVLDIDIKFKDNRGDRGGRGRGFGRGARGSQPRPHASVPHRERDSSSTSAPKVDDEKDFPSLI